MRKPRDFVFGQDRARFRPDYVDLAAGLVIELSFNTTLDLGCGQGWLTEDLAARGKDAYGIEKDGRALEHMTETALDLTDCPRDFFENRPVDRYDLVTCVEVAGHIPPAQSDELADILTVHSAEWIYLCAETPHQPGDGHINCRPQSHWIDMLHKRGFDLDLGKTMGMIERIAPLYHPQRCYWIVDNSLVFRRRGVTPACCCEPPCHASFKGKHCIRCWKIVR